MTIRSSILLRDDRHALARPLVGGGTDSDGPSRAARRPGRTQFDNGGVMRIMRTRRREVRQSAERRYHMPTR